MKAIVALLLFTLTKPVFAIECDKVTAINQRIRFAELANWGQERSHIAVNWTFEIEKLSKEKQLNMVRAFADTDACLANDAREIWFYRNKKLMGIASPTRGIQLHD